MFAKCDIIKGENLGLGWVILPNNDKIRTPLGGFINHSENPNVEYIEPPTTYSAKKRYVITTRRIKKDEELLIRYENFKK